MKKNIFYFFIFLLLVEIAPAQNKIIDSLKIVLKTEKEDTNKVNSLNTLSNKLNSIGNYAASDSTARKALALSQKLIFKKGTGLALNDIGVVYECRGNYAEALKNYFSALEIFKAISNKKLIAISYLNFGNVYSDQGNYPESLKNYFLSLEIAKAIDNKKLIAICYLNIGIIYYYQSNYQEALKNNFSALEIFKTIGDKQEIAKCYGNIGSNYHQQGNYSEALKNDSSSLEIAKSIGNKEVIAICYNCIGNIYGDQGNYLEALKNNFSSLEIAKTIGDKGIITYCYDNFGILYTKLKKYSAAKQYLQDGLSLSKKIGAKEQIRDSYKGLADLDSAIGNWKGAYENHKLYAFFKDSLANSEVTKKIVQAQMQYEFDAKTLADSIKNSEQIKQQALANKLQIQKQKTYTYTGIIGFLLMLLVAGISLRAYATKQKANILLEGKNREIANQKTVVEQKNIEITSSINYALRIQTAILPPQRIIQNYLPNSFIVYKPKDIVAGDFYWLEKMGNKILFAAADCTGHGVPGAMVSVVCHNALNRSIREFGLTKPAEILDKTAQLIIENFSKSEDEIKDGMDISLCALEQTEKGAKLEWAGANSPLWIIKNEELEETKADKQSVGNSETHLPFNNHEFYLEKGDTIYVFSDGFADQFGGEGEKKLTRKRFKKLLLSIQNKDLKEQGNELNRFITDYRKELEQTDDILVMGVKI